MINEEHLELLTNVSKWTIRGVFLIGSAKYEKENAEDFNYIVIVNSDEPVYFFRKYKLPDGTEIEFLFEDEETFYEKLNSFISREDPSNMRELLAIIDSDCQIFDNTLELKMPHSKKEIKKALDDVLYMEEDVLRISDKEKTHNWKKIFNYWRKIKEMVENDEIKIE